jgi:hypothetical protein
MGIGNYKKEEGKMGRKFLMFAGLLSIVLFASVALAGDYSAPTKVKDDGAWRFKPSFSVGYAFGDDPDLKFTLKDGSSLGGVTKSEVEVPSFSGVYIAGELPIAITDRLLLTIAGRWAFNASDEDSREVYNNNIARRDWDSDGRDWVTADLLLSYAFVKELGFLKDLSGVVGFRWDHHSMDYEDPHSVSGVLSASSNKIDFEMNTYSPVFGITSTFMGPKSGIFGGDIKLSFFGSPFCYGDMNYKESFGPLPTRIKYDGSLNDVSFYSFYGEVTALSGKVSPGMTASLLIFGQYTEFFAEERVNGTISAPFTAESKFDFDSNPSLAVVGLKAALAF